MQRRRPVTKRRRQRQRRPQQQPDTRSRQAIISAFVDFFAAMALGNVFDFNDEEYDRQYNTNGDLHKQLHNSLKQHLPKYFQLINANIRGDISKGMLRDIEYVIVETLTTQTFDQRQTRREWLRHKLTECIDQVVKASVDVLKGLQQLIPVEKAGNQLVRDYNAMIQRHEDEVAKWRQREANIADQTRTVHDQLTNVRMHRRDILVEIVPALFDPTEARYSQYVNN